MTARITRSPGIGRGRAPCTAHVHISPAGTVVAEQRIHAAKKAGRPPSECGRPSMYLVDGQPRCLNHAGQDAIKILLKEGDTA